MKRHQASEGHSHHHSQLCKFQGSASVHRLVLRMLPLLACTPQLVYTGVDSIRRQAYCILLPLSWTKETTVNQDFSSSVGVLLLISATLGNLRYVYFDLPVGIWKA